MIKPRRLKKGDKVAIVSLSWGGLGDDNFIHKFHIAKNRLEKNFGLAKPGIYYLPVHFGFTNWSYSFQIRNQRKT